MLHLHIDPERCIHCGECVADCPMGIISMKSELPTISPEKETVCMHCQHCLAVCATGALSILGKRPEDSRPLKNALPGVEEMETLIMGRRSVRRYTEKPVAPELLDRLLEVTAHAPTGRNHAERLLTLVDDPAVMEKYRLLTYRGLELAVSTGKIPAGLEFMGKLPEVFAKGRDVIYRGAPHMLVASAPADGPSPAGDCYIALSYFELLATTHGIGTVWCGMAKWAMEIVPEIRLALGLPKNHMLGYVMMFGHPDVRYHRTVQRGPAKVSRVRL